MAVSFAKRFIPSAIPLIEINHRDAPLSLEDKMTVRGYTEITPEIVGGNGAIYYQYDLPVIGNGVNTTPFIASGTDNYTC